MNSVLRIFMAGIFGLNTFAVYSQDFQFSQLQAAPLLLNPAMTGITNGSYTIGTNYKNQWISLENRFQTFSTFYQQSFLIDSASSSRIGLGLVLFNDKAGSAQLSNTEVNIALSYQTANRSKHQYFSAGFEGGVASRNINYTKLTWGSQISGNQFDPSIPSGENFSNETKNYFDFSAGALWYYIPSEKFKMFCGLSMFHINRPDQSLLNSSSDKLYSKISVQTGMQIGLDKSEKLYLIPLITYFNQGTSNQINAGGFLKYVFGSKSELSPSETNFMVGGFYRRYSTVAAVGFNYKNLGLGISYDINIGRMNSYFGASGGVEFSLRYTNFKNVKNNIKYICY